MKKQNLKLGLNKINVSKLSNINGGGPKQAHTITQLGNICCPVLGSEECPNTDGGVCTSGHPGCTNWGDDDWAYTYRGPECNFGDGD